MKWALVRKSNNIVHNIISYDGVAPYIPLDWLSLEQINDWAKIGDVKDIPQPEPKDIYNAY